MKARALGLAAAAVVAVAAIGATVVVAVGGDDPDGADEARRVATTYLTALSEPGHEQDLTDLVDDGHPDEVASGATALASATERIGGATLGEPVADDVARTEGDTVYDGFLRFPVTYRLQDEEQRSSVTLGQPRGSEEWVVVTPLTGTIGPAATSDLGTVPDVAVAGAPVADLPLPPAVYATEAGIGTWYSAAADVAVVADATTDPVAYDLQPTDAGRDAVRRQALAAFEACSSGSAYCPVATVVDITAGSWRGLSTEPTVALDGLSVTLTGGAFDHRTSRGVRTVPFEASGTVTLDPTSGEPTLAQPLVVSLRVA